MACTASRVSGASGVAVEPVGLDDGLVRLRERQSPKWLRASVVGHGCFFNARVGKGMP
jgi:hypothetical protein